MATRADEFDALSRDAAAAADRVVRLDEVEALYVDERARLERSTGHIAGDRAEDIVHDAFVTFLTHGTNVSYPRAWLGRVARNRALNDVRRSREVPLEADFSSEPDAAPAERDAIRAVVAAALGDLDERSRLALRLRFFEERDYDDVAAELGVRVAQAHVVLHRSLRRLGRAIVRRLAEAHGAASCAPALEEIAGFGGKANGHGTQACVRCRPVLDELAVLRGMGLVPPALLSMWFKRFAADVGARAPVVNDALGRVANAVVAFGLVVTTVVATPPSAPAAGDVPSRRVERERARPAVVERGVRDGRAPARTDAPVTSAPAANELREQEPEEVVDTGPVNVRKDDDHVQGEVKDEGGDPQGGAVVCEPLQPCPPPPSP